jgi:hypothetical protein
MKSTMIKKSVSVLLAVFMIASAGVVSAFAIDPGEYEATLKFVAPSPYTPPHDLDFIENPVEVINEDGNNTVTLPLKNPATVTVNGVEVSGVITDATVEAPYSITRIYDEDGVLVGLIITAPEGVDPFEPIITFEVELASGTPHSVVSAKLILVSTDQQ